MFAFIELVCGLVEFVVCAFLCDGDWFGFDAFLCVMPMLLIRYSNQYSHTHTHIILRAVQAGVVNPIFEPISHVHTHNLSAYLLFSNTYTHS